MEKQLDIIKAKLEVKGYDDLGEWQDYTYTFEDFRQSTIDFVEEFWEEDCEENIKEKKRVLKYLRTQESTYSLFRYIRKYQIWDNLYLRTRVECEVNGVKSIFGFKATKKYEPYN